MSKVNVLIPFLCLFLLSSKGVIAQKKFPKLTLKDIYKNIGDASFSVAASSNSAGTITYTSSNPSVATVSGSAITIVGVGRSTIAANQTAY